MAKGKLDNFGDNEILFDNTVNIDFSVTGDNAVQRAKNNIIDLKKEIKRLNSEIDIYKSKISEVKQKLAATSSKSWKKRYSNTIEDYNEEKISLLNQREIEASFLPKAYRKFGNAYKKSVWNTDENTNGGLGFYDRIKKFGVNKVALSTGWEDINNGLRSSITEFTDGITEMVSNVQRGFWSAGRKIRTLAASFYAIKNAMEILDGAMNGIDYMRAQAYRLKRYDTTGKSENELMKMAYKTAQNSRSSFEDISSLGQRILATNVTKGDSSEAFRLASLISKAASLGGSTDEEKSSAIRQLTQGLASNQLGGDELRSVRENAIGLTEMLAKGITKAYKEGVLNDPAFANVQIGDLKTLGKEAKLTAQVVTTAFRMMEDEINEGFKNSPKLFGQNLTALSNMWQKLMYDMSKEGKGIQRIANEMQKLIDIVSSEEGYKALKEFGNVIDEVLKGVINIVKNVVGVINMISGIVKQIPILNKLTPSNIAWLAMTGWGASMIFKFAFGSRVLGNNGKFKNIPGVLGSGGILNSIYLFLTSGLNGTLFTGIGSITRLLDSIRVAITKLTIGNSAGSATGSAVGNAVGGAVGAAISKNTLLAKIGTSLGEIAPVLGELVVVAAAIVGALAIINAVFEHKKTKWYDAESKRLGQFFADLPDEAKEEVSKYKKELLDNAFNQKQAGFAMAIPKALTSKERQDINSKLFIKEAELKDKYYQDKSLYFEAAIAENTEKTLDITTDFLKNIADMRTRTFRGELLTGSSRQGNNVVLNVSYTGEAADFEDKVVSAMYKFMNDAKAVAIPQ